MSSYVDDFIIFADSKEEMEATIVFVEKEMERFSLIHELEKG
jgi:hypothetical protein